MKLDCGPELDALVYTALTGVSFGLRDVPEYSTTRNLAMTALERWLEADCGRVADLTIRPGMVSVVLAIAADCSFPAQAPTFAHAVSLALAATVEEK